MKHILLIVSLFICSYSYSQSFHLKENTQVKDTSTVLTVENQDFVVLVSKTGNYYYNRISQKSGNEYKYYIGYKTDFVFNNLPVFTDSKGEKYYTLKINKNSFLSREELIKE